MQIEYHVLDAEGAHPVSVPVLRRLLQDGAQRPDDRYRVTIADPPLSGVLLPDDMAAFLEALDQDRDQALRLLAALGEPEAEDLPPPEPELIAEPPAPPPEAPEPPAAAPPPAPAAPPLTGWRAWVAARPMLVTFATLLVLAALLFWPRDGSRPSGVDAPEIVQSEEGAAAPEATPAAPEVVEARFVALDVAAREGPDGTTAAVRELTRGERIQVVTSGGEEQAPEGWFRLQSGGYVVAEALRSAAPPPLARRIDRDVTLQSQLEVYNGPSLAGPVQRTLATGQRVRIVGLVNDRVAEVRVGMDLGYAAYGSLFAPQEPVAVAPPGPQGPQAWPPPQIPAPDNRPQSNDLVLSAADLARAPSGETMANYYPRRAFRDRVEAQVAIQCRVLGSGRLTDCHVWRETAQGYGFAEATIRMAQETFRAPRQTRDGRPTEGAQFRATISWRVS